MFSFVTRILFGASLFLAGFTVHGTELLNQQLRDGSLPAGWSQTDVTFTTAVGGYANFTSLSAVLTTPSFDASAFADVRVQFQVAKFGSGGDGPITVEYSLNGGTDWVAAGDSPTPTGSTYLAANLLIESVSSTMQIRFTRPGSPSQKRVRDVVVTGEGVILPPGTPVLGVTPLSLDGLDYTFGEGPSSSQSFLLSGQDLDDSDVSLIAPPNFSVATAESGPFGPTATLSSFDGDSTPLWVRLEGELSLGFYSGSLTSSGGGAASIDLPLEGFVNAPQPVLTGFGIAEGYATDFASFTSFPTLPTGWTVTNEVYDGDWGSGFNAGLRGNDNVLGFQLTGGTNLFTSSLTVQNLTGETIETLRISYLGRVERLDQERHPAWTVTVGGEIIPELAYSTAVGEDQSRTAVVDGLSIPDGEFFTISWTADGNVGTSGARRQIGIGEVEVDVPEITEPLLFRSVSSLSDFTYEEGFGPSPVQSFLVSGSNLDGSDVSIVAPAFFAFSLNESSGFSDTITLPAFSGAETTIYARLAEGLSFGPYETLASISGGGAIARTISLSGSVSMPPPSLTELNPTYEQNFAAFLSSATLPVGWTVDADGTAENRLDFSPWANGGNTSTGVKFSTANANLLGYQHTGTTGIFTATLSLINDTGAPINALDISYLGKVARDDQGRSPEWTVRVNDVEQTGLFYTTDGKSADTPTPVSALATGFNVPDGEVVVITWSSDRGLGSDSSKQIGIGAVEVTVVDLDFAPPLFSVPAGFYTTSQTVFITNFADYPPSADVFYTLDGSTPTSASNLYNDAAGILVPTGGGDVTLRAIAIDGTEETSVNAVTYQFPVNVPDIETLRQQPTGPTPILLTNPATFIGGTLFRNTKFFQDDSGFGIQIDDTAGVITTTYAIGDQVGSLYGTLGSFQGQLQFVPLEDPGAPVDTGIVIEPVSRTLQSLGFDDQARLVVIEGIVFDAGDGVATFGGGGSNTPISDFDEPLITGIFRNIFGESDITDSVIPETPVTIVGIVQETNGGTTIGARSLADITPFVVVPQITSALEVSTPFDEFFSYQITATGDPVSFGANGLPDGLSVNTETGVISGTPTESSLTPFEVELSATNAAPETGFATLLLTVTPELVDITFSGPTSFIFTGAGQSPAFTVDPEVAVSLSYEGIDGTVYGPSATAPVNVGTYRLTVTVTEPNYGGVESQDFAITPASQTITFAPLPSRNIGDADFVVEATASSGLPVSFTIDGPATLVGGSTSPATVSLTGVADTVTITASQAGDGNYLAADPVVQSFEVTADGQFIVSLASPVTIPDAIGQTTIDLEVTEEGVIQEIAVVLSLLNHPEVTALRATLQAPVGTDGPEGRASALLFDFGAYDADIVEVTFAHTSLQEAFGGLSMLGTWTLVIDQNASLWAGFLGDGSLTQFDLVITEDLRTILQRFLDSAPEGLNAFLDDASGDGMSNLLSYALGATDASVSNVGLLPVPEEGCGPDRVALTFLRLAGGVPSLDGYWEVDGITYAIEGSTTLAPGSWSPIEVEEIATSTIGVPFGYVRVTVCPVDPIGLDGRGFLRLVVSTGE